MFKNKLHKFGNISGEVINFGLVDESGEMTSEDLNLLKLTNVKGTKTLLLGGVDFSSPNLMSTLGLKNLAEKLTKENKTTGDFVLQNLCTNIDEGGIFILDGKENLNPIFLSVSNVYEGTPDKKRGMYINTSYGRVIVELYKPGMSHDILINQINHLFKDFEQ